MSDVIEYYTNEYDEESRLGKACDNRHTVEREVKKRILSDFIMPGSRVLDIGAGTGLYSIYVAKMGCQVTACDIVPKHVEMITNKAAKENVPLTCQVEDALSLSFRNNSFDYVLLAGPIYHLKPSEQLQAIAEAYRVCRPGGLVFVDYLSKVHGYLQHILLDKDTLMKGALREVEDPVFSYNSLLEISRYFEKVGLCHEMVFGTDSITRFFAKDINKLDEEHLAEYIRYIYKISSMESIVDMSEHCIAVGRKMFR